MHNWTEKIQTIPILIEAIAIQLKQIIHLLLHEMKTVQMILNEDLNSETASSSDSESEALTGSAPTASAMSPVHGLVDCISNSVKWTARFSNIKIVIGRALCLPCPKQWQCGSDLILMQSFAWQSDWLRPKSGQQFCSTSGAALLKCEGFI